MLIAYPTATSTDNSRKDFEQDINILYNSIASSSTQKDYSSVYLDIISDADGYNNTINDGTSTATDNTTNRSNNVAGTPETQNSAFSVGGTSSTRTITGTCSTTGFFNRVYINANTGTHQVTIKKNGVQIATKEAYGGASYFDFTASDYSDFLISGDTWIILLTGDSTYQTASGKSYTGTNFSYTSQTICGNASAVDNFGFTPLTASNLYVNINAITIDETPEYFSLFCHNDLVGTGNITYDISFNNGTTTQTGNALTDKILLNHESTGQCLITIHLNGTGSNSATIYDYGLMIYEVAA